MPILVCLVRRSFFRCGGNLPGRRDKGRSQRRTTTTDWEPIHRAIIPHSSAKYKDYDGTGIKPESTGSLESEVVMRPARSSSAGIKIPQLPCVRSRCEDVVRELDHRLQRRDAAEHAAPLVGICPERQMVTVALHHRQGHQTHAVTCLHGLCELVAGELFPSHTHPPTFSSWSA